MNARVDRTPPVEVRRRVRRVDDLPAEQRGQGYWIAALERYARLLASYVHAAVFARDDETRQDAVTFAVGTAELSLDTIRQNGLSWHPGAHLVRDLLIFILAPRGARRRSPGAHVPAAIHN